MSYVGNLTVKCCTPGFSSNRFAGNYSSVTSTQANSYLGIRGVTTPLNDAITVMVDSSGHLGTISSSERYKDKIEDMSKDPEISQNGKTILHKLRPVTFSYKSDPKNDKHVGLIAEEVDKVYKPLCIYDNKGIPETVRYHDIIPLLVYEIQLQAKHINSLQSRLLTDSNNSTNNNSIDSKNLTNNNSTNNSIDSKNSTNSNSIDSNNLINNNSTNNLIDSKNSVNSNSIDSKKNEDFKSMIEDILKKKNTKFINQNNELMNTIKTQNSELESQNTVIKELKKEIDDMKILIDSMKKTNTKEIKLLKTGLEKLNKSMYDKMN